MASITRLSTKLLSLLACCLLAFAAMGARAEGINVTRSSATLTADGRLSVNSRFQTELPGQLQVALKQGVPLNFHPLTDRYRVSVGSFSTEYGTLPTALKAVGAVANWQVLDKGTLSDTAPADVAADIRLSLSISDLPRPFQINGETSKSWQLDSGWRKLLISQQ